MKLSVILPAALLVTCFLSCKKSDSDSNSGGSIQYQLQTTNRSTTIRTAATPTIQWSSGTAFASSLKLEAKNSSGQEVEYKTQVAQQVDLFTSVAAALGNVTIPAGTYAEVEFKVFVDPSGSNPALRLNGSFTNSNGTVIPVSFVVNSHAEIKAEVHNVTVDNTTSTTALTTLNLAALTSGINASQLNSATVSNGTIVISSSSNSALYSILVSNLGHSHEVEVHHH